MSLQTRMASRARLDEARSAIAYFSREPTGTSSRNPASTGFPSGPDRRGNDHAVRFHATQLARLQIHDDHHFAAHQLFRLIRRGDSGDDLADFVADVHHHFQQFVGAGHAFGGLHLADAHLHFGEIVDADLRICRWGVCRCGCAGCAAGAAAGADGVAGVPCGLRISCSMAAIFSRVSVFSTRGKTAAGSPIRVPGRKPPQAS